MGSPPLMDPLEGPEGTICRMYRRLIIRRTIITGRNIIIKPVARRRRTRINITRRISILRKTEKTKTTKKNTNTKKNKKNKKTNKKGKNKQEEEI